MSLLDSARVADILRTAADTRVLVVGDLMLDRYVSGRVDRVSPEAPVPVLLVEEERVAVGGAGNVAANVTSLGASCAIVACTGEDPEADQVSSALAAAGVESSGVVRVASRPTTVKTRVVTKHQQIVRFDREVDRQVEPEVGQELRRSLRTALEAIDAVVLQDYDKGVLTPDVVGDVLAVARAARVPVVVDPKRRGFFEYPGVSVFKPNRRELEDALGEVARPEDGVWMESTRRRLGCDHLLVTLGEHGMALQSDGQSLIRLPAAAQAVYDVSGAGDTVSAVVAVALATRASVVEAAVIANYAAAIEVARPGVHTVTPSEITAFARSRANTPATLEPEDQA